MLKKIPDIRGRLQLFGLFFAGSTLAVLLALPQVCPGYMDADYYFHVGTQLASGQGFVQQVVWNFLDQPNRLPTISHTYWMPLASIVSMLGMIVTGNLDFISGRLLFLGLAGLIPVITYSFTWKVTGSTGKSFLAGCLALVSGFYLPYLSTTDTFTIFMILGGGYFLIAEKLLSNPGEPASHLCLFTWGITTGLLHLTRVEGLFWFGGAVLAWVYFSVVNTGQENRRRLPGRLITEIGWILLGYQVIMVSWYGRNISTMQSIFPTGNSKSFWLVAYEDIFLFPSSLITPQRWLESGMSAILQNRVDAIWTNFQTFVAVQGEIILLPFILMGLFEYRKKAWACLAGALWLAIFLLMSVFFPFAGKNGGFFHSGAAFQPVFWTLSVVGLASAVNRLITWRGWEKRSQVHLFFRGIVLSVCLILSVNAYLQKMSGGGGGNPWNQSYLHYQAVESFLFSMDPGRDNLVMVNNPPGYTVAARRPAIVIPFGDVNMLLVAGKQFQAKYIVLEPHNSSELKPVYDHPGDILGLKYLGDVEKTRIFEILD